MNEARIFIEGLLPSEKNLVTNGDLRNRIIDGWNVLDEYRDSYVIVFATISTGDIQYYANDEEANIRVEQVASIINGTPYTAKINITNATGAARVRMVIGANTSDWFTTVGEHTFDIVADGTTFYLEFDNTTSSPETAAFGTMDVNLVAIYEPVSDNQLDLKEFGLELQYGIDNIKDISKISSSFSLDFEIPNTDRNARIFKYYYELDVTESYNPNKGLKAYLEVNSNEIYRGILKLNRLVKNEEGSIVGYNVQFNGTLFGLLQEWGDTNLNELDFSELNHSLFKEYVVGSWSFETWNNGGYATRSAGDGYIYPLIDNGNVNWGSNVTLGISDPSIPLEKIYPGIFAWYYWQKIFEYAGATYESTFIDSDFFKRLVIPFNGKEILLTPDQIIERLYQASVANTYNQNITQDNVQNEAELTEFGAYNNDSTGGNFDNTDGYNTSNFQWTAQKSGIYNFNASLDMRWRMTINDALPFGSSSGYFSTTQGTTARLQLKKSVPPGDVLLYESDPIDLERYTGTLPVGVTESDDFTLTLNAQNIKLYAGETVFIHVKYVVEQDPDTAILSDANGGAYPIYSLYYFRIDVPLIADDIPQEYNNGQLEMKFVSGTWSNEVVNSGIMSGDEIDMNAAAVRNLSIIDFFTSICKMFYLTVVPDVNNPKKFYIEPYVDYISNDVVNWDQKRDTSREQIVEPLGELDAKRFVFKYADDEDFYNKHYKEKWATNGYNFASRVITVDNDFLVGDSITEIAFAPTIVVDEHPGKVILPAIFDEERKQMQTRPRILHYSGFVSGEPMYIIAEGSPLAVTSTPAFTMFDNKYTPTQSLEFGFSGTEYYWNNPDKTVPLTITNNNLYNKYYSKYVADITDTESKKVTAWFTLDSNDIYNLDFSKLHYWSGYYFRLLKVYYNPLSSLPSKCEFLKVKDNPEFTPVTTDVGGGVWVGDTVGTGGTIEPNPGRDTLSLVGSSVFPFGAANSEANGDENYVSQAAINSEIVNGEGNRIYESENVQLTNCYNVTVQSGVNNVVAINCEDLVITESGTYISGIMIGPISSAIRVTIPCPGSNPTGEFIRKTCLEMLELMDQASSPAGCGLQVGKYYWITDVLDGDGTNDAGVIVQAVARNKVSKSGHMIALNADYQNEGTYVFTGLFTGTNLGVWTDALTPVTGDCVIWNNIHWRNLTGTNTTDSPDIDAVNWLQVDRHTDNGYIREVDFVLWDMDSCSITYRADKRGNLINLNAILGITYDLCQFGNDNWGQNTNVTGKYDVANSRGVILGNVLSADFMRVNNQYTGTIQNNYFTPDATLDTFLANSNSVTNCTIGRPIYLDELDGNLSNVTVTNEHSDRTVIVDLDTALTGTDLLIPNSCHVAGKIVFSSSNATETIDTISFNTTFFPDCIAISGIWFESENGLTTTINPTAIGSAATNDILYINGNPVVLVGRTNGPDKALIMRDDTLNKILIYNSWT